MSEPLQISQPLLSEVFDRLRACGGGREECVVFLTAPHDSRVVAEVVLPDHDASPWHYEIHGSWMTGFFASLRETGRTAVAQIHTHGGRAFHSTTDDRFPLVPAVGFLSLVVPNFARGPVSLNGMYAAVLDVNGWRAVSPGSVVSVVPDAG